MGERIYNLIYAIYTEFFDAALTYEQAKKENYEKYGIEMLEAIWEKKLDEQKT